MSVLDISFKSELLKDVTVGYTAVWMYLHIKLTTPSTLIMWLNSNDR